MYNSPPNNDNELLRLIAEGNETAFRKLFVDHHQLIGTHIFRITKSKQLTEEIVQDIFLKIWMARETLAQIENFNAYLFIISRNHTLNVLRKIAKEQERHKTWEKQHQPESGNELENLPLSLVDEAIEKLPVRQRETYLLHRHHRLTYHEIADQLGISKETVKTHLKLAVGFITKYVCSRLTLLAIFIFW